MLCACAVIACGCSPDSPTSHVIPATALSTSQPSSDFAKIPNEFPSPPATTGNGQAEAPVGGCVNLAGPGENAVLTLVDCDSTQNTYRIIQRVNTPQECVHDSDRTYYHNSKDTGQFTACLDLAWDGTSCMSLGHPVTKVSCSDPSAPNKIKPLKVILDSTTLAGCPSDGYSHPDRRFTVCTQEQP